MKGHVENVKWDGGSIVLTVRVHLRDGPKGNHREATVEYHKECIEFLRENMKIKSLHVGECMIHQDVVPDEQGSIYRHETAIAGFLASKCGGK